jgi:hypothetical protein
MLNVYSTSPRALLHVRLRGVPTDRQSQRAHRILLAVAAQVACIRAQILKPVFHFIEVQGLKPGAFKRYGSTALNSCTGGTRVPGTLRTNSQPPPHLGHVHGEEHAGDGRGGFAGVARRARRRRHVIGELGQQGAGADAAV